MMNNIKGMLELVDMEFGEILARGNFRNPDEIEMAHYMMEIAKDGHCVLNYENGGMSKMYSGDGEDASPEDHEKHERMDWYSNKYGRSGGYSGRAYRSGTGRMAHPGMNWNTGRPSGYSHADATQEFIENLHDMMATAPDDRTRECVKRMITELEQ